MRVIVPFTVRHPRVEAAVPVGAEWRDVSGDSHAYWRLMCELWADQETFAVVEHDVLWRSDVTDQFASCLEPWCVFRYRNICHAACMDAWANMLGCTRFRAELIRARPHAVISIPENQRDWHNLCDSIAGDKVGGMPAPLRPGSLRAGGFKHHWHHPGVRHISWEGHAREAEDIDGE